MSKENKTVELNEDELDKVVGGDVHVRFECCPNCHTETLWDNGKIIYCTLCNYIEEHS